MAERHHPHLPHLHGGDDADDIDDVDNIGVTSGTGGRNPYASANRWRHQESSAFARHAAASASQPRDEEGARNDVKDLTAFLNSSRITPSESTAAAGAAGGTSTTKGSAKNSPSSGSAARFKPIVVPGEVDTAASARPTTADGKVEGVPSDGKEILVGPLLNYRRMEGDNWIGSALIVTRGGGETQSFVPTAVLGSANNAVEPEPAPAGGPGGPSTNGTSYVAKASSGGAQEIQGVRLYSDPRNTFWRFDLSVPMGETESRWQYSFPGLRYASDSKPRTSIFSVPAVTEAMRILFFSCNGFSVGTDEDAWSGPALWNDVIRCHAKTPFHVMIGGGDQIYNDSIRVSGPLREWTAIGNPKKRRDFPFTEKLRAACDDFYLNNYIQWYSTEPFAATNGQIPQLNIWDDHDVRCYTPKQFLLEAKLTGMRHAR